MPKRYPGPYTTSGIPVTNLPPELLNAEQRFRWEAAADRATVRLLFSNTYQQVDDFTDPYQSRIQVGVLDLAPVPLQPQLLRLMAAFVGSLSVRSSIPVTCHTLSGDQPLQTKPALRRNDVSLNFMPAQNLVYGKGRKHDRGMTSSDDFTVDRQVVLSFAGVGRDLRDAAVVAGTELTKSRLTLTAETDEGYAFNHAPRFQNALARSVGVMTRSLADGLKYSSYKDSVTLQIQKETPTTSAFLVSGARLMPRMVTFSYEVYEHLAHGIVPPNAVPLAVDNLRAS